MSLIGCTGFEFALQDQIHKPSQSERTSTAIEATLGGLPEPGPGVAPASQCRAFLDDTRSDIFASTSDKRSEPVRYALGVEDTGHVTDRRGTALLISYLIYRRTSSCLTLTRSRTSSLRRFSRSRRNSCYSFITFSYTFRVISPIRLQEYR
jgi:hypothetical protein